MAAHTYAKYGAVRKKITPKHRSCSELWPPKAIQYTAETVRAPVCLVGLALVC